MSDDQAEKRPSDEELVDWTSLASLVSTDPGVAELREALAESQRWRRRMAEAITDKDEAIIEAEMTVLRVRELHIADRYGRCIGCLHDDQGPLIDECPTLKVLDGDMDPSDYIDYDQEEED